MKNIEINEKNYNIYQKYYNSMILCRSGSSKVKKYYEERYYYLDFDINLFELGEKLSRYIKVYKSSLQSVEEKQLKENISFIHSDNFEEITVQEKKSFLEQMKEIVTKLQRKQELESKTLVLKKRRVS